MARHQRLHLVLVLLELALLSTFFQAAEAFVPSIPPLERRPTPPAMLLLQAHDASSTTTTTDPAEQAAPVTKPSRSRARRQLASFDRRDALRAGSALALGLAVLGSTTTSSSSSSIPGSALAAVPPSPAPESTADGLIGGSASTLVAATTETAAAAAAAGADASSSQASSPLADFISGLAGGAASRASKELLLHPLDTIRTRLQYAKGDEPPAELFKDLYDGVWPALLVGTPAGAAFFATKDVLKGYAKQYFGSEYRELTTIAAVLVANFPYWAIRNPAEVIKTQQQAGLVDGTVAAVQEAVAREGVSGLYRGFASNVAYAFPTDAIKFVVYESLQKNIRRKLNPLESSVCGAAASCVAQLLSTPLDVVRTRVMTQEQGPEGAGAGAAAESPSVLATAQAIAREEGVGKLFSGLAPRLTRALLSGAIQFGSYEFTKGTFAPKK